MIRKINQSGDQSQNRPLIGLENNNDDEQGAENNDSNLGAYQSDIYGNLYADFYNMASDNRSTVLLNETESTTNSRPLIVVVVRGSVTKKDWENNFRTQFVPQDNRFDALKEEISDNLSSYIEVLCQSGDGSMIGTLVGLDNTDYSHLLATWAMELSYTAYNYPNGDWLVPIPGLFMGDVDKPATTFLAEHGFENVSYYNYDHDESVAHVVAHKNIMFSSHESEQENTEGDNENGISYNNRSTYSGIPGDTIYDGGSSLGLSISSDTTYNGLFPSVTSTVSNSLEESGSSNIRPLIVVDIRGSVTIFDWVMNFLTQGHLKFYEFEDGADDVIETLCGYEGCTECTVEDENCDCRGYLNNVNQGTVL